MKKNAKIKIALAGAGLFAAIAIPLAALAYPPTGIERVYFDNAAHTTIVGEETMYCSGKTTLWWGTQTPYFDYEIIDCGSVLDPYNP